MSSTFIDTASMKVYTSGNYPFLIVEPLGNLSLEEYKTHLSNPVILAILDHRQLKMVYLELNGIWSVGMDQQEWTVKEFEAALKAKGVVKVAIGLAEHVYPTFAMLAASYEQQAVLPTKYFADLDSMVAFLR
jgi:RNA-binding protein YhbY